MCQEGELRGRKTSSFKTLILTKATFLCMVEMYNINSSYRKSCVGCLEVITKVCRKMWNCEILSRSLWSVIKKSYLVHHEACKADKRKSGEFHHFASHCCQSISCHPELQSIADWSTNLSQQAAPTSSTWQFLTNIRFEHRPLER